MSNGDKPPRPVEPTNEQPPQKSESSPPPPAKTPSPTLEKTTPPTPAQETEPRPYLRSPPPEPAQDATNQDAPKGPPPQPAEGATNQIKAKGPAPERVDWAPPEPVAKLDSPPEPEPTPGATNQKENCTPKPIQEGASSFTRVWAVAVEPDIIPVIHTTSREHLQRQGIQRKLAVPETHQEPSPHQTEADREGLLREATTTLKGAGEVDSDAYRAFMDRLPSIPITGETADEKDFKEAAAHALGRAPEGVTIAKVGGKGHRGGSGAPVYMVSDQVSNELCAVKEFPASRSDEFVRELSALDRLGREGLRVARPLMIGKSGESGIIFSERASGSAVDQLMLKTGDASEPQERHAAFRVLQDAVACNAEVLAELHTRPSGSGGRASPDFINWNIRAVEHMVAQFEAPNTSIILEQASLDTDQLKGKVNKLAASFRANPGRSAITHGDAHPGNFLYDPAARTITIIDTSTLPFSINSVGNPAGVSARDVAVYYEKLAHFGEEFGLEHADIISLQSIFRQSYENVGGAKMTSESQEFFRARTALNELYKSLGEVKVNLVVEPGKGEAIVRKVDFVKEALGI